MPSQGGIPIVSEGGYVVANLSDQTTNPDGVPGDTYFVIDVTSYRIDAAPITSDVTTSYHTGGGTRVSAAKRRIDVTITLPEDMPSSIESVGTLVANGRFTLYCRRGGTVESAKFDIVANTTFVGFAKENDVSASSDRKVTLNFSGGTYSGYQAAPAALAAYLTSISRT